MRVREKYPRISATELLRRGYHVVFVQIGYKRGFLFSERIDFDNLPRVFPITLEEKRNVPLYKQAMELQMGQIPQQYQTESNTYYARVLEMNECKPHIAWEVI